MPKTFDYLAILRSSSFDGYRPLIPEWNNRYFEVLGERDRAAYQRTKDALLSKWPTASYDALRWGRLDQPPRPDLIEKPLFYSSGMWREWVAELTRLASDRSVLVFIPVYADTTQEDLSALWARIQAEKGQPPRRRARPDQYERRLQVWDAYQQLGTFPAVARRLHLRPSTVKGNYLQASRDIRGPTATVPRTHQHRLLQSFDPATHVQHCPTCQAATQADDMCPAARTYFDQDTHTQRERPTDPARLDRRSKEGSRSRKVRR